MLLILKVGGLEGWRVGGLMGCLGFRVYAFLCMGQTPIAIRSLCMGQTPIGRLGFRVGFRVSGFRVSGFQGLGLFRV